jgi:hypothetical protein
VYFKLAGWRQEQSTPTCLTIATKRSALSAPRMHLAMSNWLAVLALARLASIGHSMPSALT